MTYDLDLMIALDRVNILRTMSALQALGFRPKLPIEMMDFAREELRRMWREEKNMLVFSLSRGTKEFYTVDIFTENPLDFDQCFARRLTITGGDLNIPVVSSSDLIAMKKLATRAQDADDIESLEKLRRLRGEN
ncbi:MAG: hypothetical protein HYR77_11270 [Ignavibacteria bacterium]|nr:hypothetical protein [Ignavibacteria bacterium]